MKLDNILRRFTTLIIFFFLVAPLSAAGQCDGYDFGLRGAAALALSPLGEIAEQNGLYAIPGVEYEARVFARSSGGAEWSLGVLWDSYGLSQSLGPTVVSTFDYESAAVVVGYARRTPMGGTGISSGVDVGWVHFRTHASTPNRFTGAVEESRETVDGVTVATVFGIEIPSESVTFVPKLRIGVNFPDFGGGEGASFLHQENDLGFKLSVGLAVTAW